YGEQKYAVRIQVDPDKLAAHQVGIDEVQRAVQQSNVNLPTGRLQGPKQAFTVQSSGQLTEASAYRPLIVEYRNGVPLRLDVLAKSVDDADPGLGRYSVDHRHVCRNVSARLQPEYSFLDGVDS